MTKKTELSNQSLKIPKAILITASILQTIYPKWAARFATKLFITPLKHKIPKRELKMDTHSKQSILFIPKIKKSIVVYEYGSFDKKVLLVHGWSGRGTQLFKCADALLEKGFKVISFDAPAHGKSGSSTTIMPEFIACILEIQKQFGSFEFAVGHSLGGMSIINAVKRGLIIKKAVIIGSGDIIQDIIERFVAAIQLQPKIALMMKNQFEFENGESMENYATSIAAKEVTIPVLIVHDKDDVEVPVSCAENIHHHLKNSTLLITERLGHRKILGNERVIQQLLLFLEN
jgi:pimeloyl-ACP methyl ester carboxylesterase